MVLELVGKRTHHSAVGAQRWVRTLAERTVALTVNFCEYRCQSSSQPALSVLPVAVTHTRTRGRHRGGGNIEKWGEKTLQLPSAAPSVISTIIVISTTSMLIVISPFVRSFARSFVCWLLLLEAAAVRRAATSSFAAGSHQPRSAESSCANAIHPFPSVGSCRRTVAGGRWAQVSGCCVLRSLLCLRRVVQCGGTVRNTQANADRRCGFGVRVQYYDEGIYGGRAVAWTWRGVRFETETVGTARKNERKAWRTGRPIRLTGFRLVFLGFWVFGFLVVFCWFPYFYYFYFYFPFPVSHALHSLVTRPPVRWPRMTARTGARTLDGCKEVIRGTRVRTQRTCGCGYAVRYGNGFCA